MANAGLLGLMIEPTVGQSAKWRPLSQPTSFVKVGPIILTTKWQPCMAKQMTAIWDKSLFAPDNSPFIFKSVKIDRNEEISRGCFRGVKAICPLSDQIGKPPLSIASNVFVNILVLMFVVRHGIRVIETMWKVAQTYLNFMWQLFLFFFIFTKGKYNTIPQKEESYKSALTS